MTWQRHVAQVLLPFVLATSGAAQNLLPNPSLDAGGTQPEGWVLDGTGRWLTTSATTNHVLEVEGSGDDQGRWRATPIRPLAPGACYSLHFRGHREPGASGGTAVAGTDRVSRDFPLTESWRESRFVFRQPDLPEPSLVRLGQWHARGKIQFDDVGLWPVMVAHRRSPDDIELGDGESLRAGIYRFEPRFNGPGANIHRPLVRATAGFNSDRWLFSQGSEVVYRLGAIGSTQQTARVRVALNHFEAGTLAIEVRRATENWAQLGTLGTDRRTGLFELPAGLFPCGQVELRLAGGPGAALQVDTIEYEARLTRSPQDFEGQTYVLESQQQSDVLGVNLRQIRYREDRGLWELTLILTNRTDRAQEVRGSLSTERASPMRVGRLPLPAQSSRELTLETKAEEPGSMPMFVLLRGMTAQPLFVGQTTVQLATLSDTRPGHWLSATNALDLWWCESGWKIGRDRGPPARPRAGAPDPVRIAAAGNEYEAFQIALRPNRDGRLTAVRPDPFLDANGQPAAVTLRVNEVAWVHVTRATDDSCLPGWYPDPLPPLSLPLELVAGRNQSLWATVHVPPGTAPGTYRAQLKLESSSGAISIPIELEVFGFDLPRETHLHSALGMGASSINRYHRLERPEDRQIVFDRYLQNFAEHRISPYSFYDHAPIDVRVVRDGDQPRVQLDFRKFDAAAERWLGPGGFNSFQLPLVGMGGGTFHSRHLGELGGFKEGTPEHTRLFRQYLGDVEAHLREHGWLSKAFTYWFDEPDPKDYEFVIAGMDRLKTAAPGIRRMLTEQPEPALFGHVDLWCALTPEWTTEKVRDRRAAGEETWWYICTAPKTPYVTEFIDHPAVEPRLWPWQSWQFGIQGILIWATIYWHSPAAYPDRLQDPWTDPMSWVSDYGFQPGQRQPWGNGDGRFLYPPRRDPNTSKDPDLNEPINSIRWENLRDGMEDYEYLWLLGNRIERAQANTKTSPELLQRARALLVVPESISKELTRFTSDPRSILEHRRRLAQMIVQLPP